MLKTLTRLLVSAVTFAEGVLPPALISKALRVLGVLALLVVYLLYLSCNTKADANAKLLEDRRQAEPFVWLAAEHLQQLVKSCKYSAVHAGAVVVKQGQDLPSAFLVSSSSLSTYTLTYADVC